MARRTSQRNQRKRRAGLPSGRPPPMYYDPAIDAQVRASERGLGNLLADISLARSRGESDFNFAREDITRQRDETLADLLTGLNRQGVQFDWQQQDLDTGYNRGIFDLDRGYGRGMEDSRLAESRLGEDYRSALAGLAREYERLAGRQSQAAAAAGVGAGGVFAQAAAKRAENQAWDRRPIDTSYERSLSDLLRDRSRMTEDYGTTRGRMTEDYGTALSRLGTQRGWAQEDYQTAVGRTQQAADRDLGLLNTQWDRQVTDWGRQEQRATDETRFFGQDAHAQRWFQARQAGYQVPAANRRRRR